jgi:site-specific DNA recombinase
MKASLFTGILFDNAGTRYTPTHANKDGRRYRYYTSQVVIKKTEKGIAPARIPAHDLETAVVGRILAWLQSPTELLAVFRDEAAQAVRKGSFVRILAQAAKTVQSWPERIAADRMRFLKTVIERVVIHPSHLEICLRVPAVVNEILGADLAAAGLPPIVSLDCAFRHVQQGRALRLVIGDTSITTDASRHAILKAIARARHWYAQITTGQAGSIAQLAGLHGLSPRFIRMHMKLVQLGPSAIETMMCRPHSLPLSLTDLLATIPMSWSEQITGAPASASLGANICPPKTLNAASSTI